MAAERRLAALKEVKTGQVFVLSHPLDKPGGQVLNQNRKPPVFHPVFRGTETYFNLESSKIDFVLEDEAQSRLRRAALVDQPGRRR